MGHDHDRPFGVGIAGPGDDVVRRPAAAIAAGSSDGPARGRPRARRRRSPAASRGAEPGPRAQAAQRGDRRHRRDRRWPGRSATSSRRARAPARPQSRIRARADGRRSTRPRSARPRTRTAVAFPRARRSPAPIVRRDPSVCRSCRCRSYGRDDSPIRIAAAVTACAPRADPASYGRAMTDPPGLRVYETVVYASDVDRTTAFYRDVLHLRQIDGPDRVQRRAAARRRLGAADLRPRPFVDGRSRVPAHGALGAGHIAFAVGPGELSGWRRRLSELGVALEQEQALG